MEIPLFTGYTIIYPVESHWLPSNPMKNPPVGPSRRLSLTPPPHRPCRLCRPLHGGWAVQRAKLGAGHLEVEPHSWIEPKIIGLQWDLMGYIIYIYPQNPCLAVAKIVIRHVRILLLVQAKRVFFLFLSSKKCILTCGHQWIWARPFCVAGAVFYDLAKKSYCIFAGRRATFCAFGTFWMVFILCFFSWLWRRFLHLVGVWGWGHINVLSFPSNDVTLLAFFDLCEQVSDVTQSWTQWLSIEKIAWQG